MVLKGAACARIYAEGHETQQYKKHRTPVCQGHVAVVHLQLKGGSALEVKLSIKRRSELLHGHFVKPRLSGKVLGS